MKHILEHTAHRPWPLPRGPWVMYQRWHGLLFAHRPAAPAAVAATLPAGLELDTFDGRAWIGVVPFQMAGVRARGTPALPGLSCFPELNVRTYVTRGGKPGVWFYSLDAGNAVAVSTARAWLNLPYFRARMRYEREHGEGRADGAVRYASERTHRRAPPAVWRGRYRPTGPVRLPRAGTLEHWLTERYCLYSSTRRGLLRLEVQHAPWPLQAAEAELEVDTLAEAAGLAPDPAPPLLHYSERQEVLAWWPERC